MANSSSVPELKQELIKQIINCPLLVKALDAKDIDPDIPEELVGKYIYSYMIDPDTITDPVTFITVSTHIPRTNFKDMWASPQIQVMIVSHKDHMRIDPKEIKTYANRNDFISQIIDVLVNDKDKSDAKFGMFGELALIRNTEGNYSKDWLFREMIFETVDLNRSLCERYQDEFFSKYGY